MMDLPRTQHVVASGLIACVGVTVAWISYTQEPAEAYVFPRLIASVFAVLAIWTFGKAVTGRTKVGAGLGTRAMRNIAPGLVVTLIYVFWAAKTLGFYAATAAAFLVLLSLYDPAPHGAVRSWVKRIAITAGVMTVLYGLFAGLLNVFTPRGAFF